MAFVTRYNYLVNTTIPFFLAEYDASGNQLGNALRNDRRIGIGGKGKIDGSVTRLADTMGAAGTSISTAVTWSIVSGAANLNGGLTISGNNVSFTVSNSATKGSTVTLRCTANGNTTNSTTIMITIIKPVDDVYPWSISSPNATIYDYTDPSGGSAKIAYMSRNTSLTLNVAMNPSDATNTDITESRHIIAGLPGETSSTFMTFGTKTKSGSTTSIPVTVKDVDISGSKLIYMRIRPDETYYNYSGTNVFFVVVESAPTSTTPITFADGRLPYDNSGNSVGAGAFVADASGSYKYAMKIGETNQQLACAVLPSNASQDITWTSSNTAVATVSGDGWIASVLGAGETVITATSKQDSTKSSTIRIAVTGATIEPVGMAEIVARRKYNDTAGSSYPAGSVVQPTLQPDSTYAIMLMRNNTFNLSTVIYPSNVDNSGVVWTSDDTFNDYITLSATGEVSGVAEGTVTVTATSAADSSFSKTVKIVVFIHVPVMGISQLGVTITNNGLQLQRGDSVIYGDASGNRIVKPSSLVTFGFTGTGVVPSNATNKQINYTLSDAAFGTLSPESSTNGYTTITTGTTEGVYTLTATTAESGYSRSFSFRVMAYTDVSGIADISSNVTPVSDASLNNVLVTRIAAGSTLQLSSAIIPADAYFNTLLWAINDKNDYDYAIITAPTGFTEQPSAKQTGAGVSIDASGLFTATATSSGYVFVTASAGGKMSQPFYIYVEALAAAPVSSITVSAAGNATSVAVNRTLQLSATAAPENAIDKTVTWSSSDTSLATVNSYGLVTGIAIGSVTITATANDGSAVYGTYNINITQLYITNITINANNAIYVGLSGELQLGLDITPFDAPDQSVTWSSSDTSVATVNSYGRVSGVALGTVTITATANDGSAVYETYNLTVIKQVTSITISSAGNATQLSLTEPLQLTANISPEDATIKAVTWSSTNTLIATVDASGLVTSVAEGNVTITATATDESSIYGTINLYVYNVITTGVAPFTIDISGDATTYYPTQDASGIYTFTVEQGKYFFVNTSVLPTNATNQNVTIAQSAYISSVPVNGIGAGFDISNGRKRFYATDLSTLDDTNGVAFTAEAYPTSNSNLKSYIRFTVVDAQPVAATGVTVSAADNKNYVAVSSTLQLSASVEPANAADKSVSWSSSDVTKATVDASGLVTGVADGSVTITATTTSGGHTDSITLNVVTNYVQITGVAVQRGRERPYKVGETLQMSYTYIPLDSTDNRVTWSSSNSSVATVDASGLVTFVGVGAVAVSATAVDNPSFAIGTDTTLYAYGVNDVLPTGLAVSPSSATINKDATQALSAVFTPGNTTDQRVTWSSSNDTIVAIDSIGQIVGFRPGSATITATCVTDGTITATAAITVVIPVSDITIPNNLPDLEVGSYNTGTLIAVISPPNATNKAVTWSSSDSSIATVDASGLVTGIANGSVIITATSVADPTKTYTITVTVVTRVSSVTVSAAGGATSVGTNATLQMSAAVLPLTASSPTVTWSIVSRTGAADASIDSSTGLLSAGASAGSVNIRATADGVGSSDYAVTITGGVVAVTGVSVSGSSLSMQVGGSTQSLTATVSPADASNKAVTWSSSNTAVATVDASGVVTAVANGSATITATSVADATKSGAYGPITVTTPVSGVSVSGSTLAMTVGGSTQSLTATVSPAEASNKAVTWSSSDSSVATVDASGVVTAVANGSATITATSVADATKSGAYGPITVTTPVSGVSVSGSTLAMSVGGSTQSLTATVSPAGASNKAVTWSSSDSSVATVDASGVVTAVANGSATITATSMADGTKSGSYGPITVTTPVSGVSVSGSTLAMTVGGSTQSLTATVSPAGASNKAVTWSSSDSSVATVDASGVVTAVANGSATITATSVADATKSGAYGPITVTTPVSSVTVSAAGGATSVAVNQTLQMSATVLPVTASNPTVTWSIVSRTGAVDTTINSSTGLLSAGEASGSVNIRATADGVNSTNYTVTITAVVAVSGVSVSGSTLAMTVGGSTQSLTATVSPTDATNKAVTWSSSNSAVATVDASGVVTAVANGSATITATSVADATKSGSYGPITVTTLVSSVAVADASGATSRTLTDRGQTRQLTATVSPTGASNKAVTWSSSNTAVATVDASGLVTVVDSGSATIRATSVEGSKQSNTYSLTVSIPVSSVDISGPLTMTVGDVSGWSLSFLPTYATNKTTSWTATGAISVDSSGNVTAVSAGSGTLKATVGGVDSALYTVTVQNGNVIPVTLANITFDASSNVYTSSQDGVTDASAGIFNDGTATRDFIYLNTSVTAAPGQSLAVNWTSAAGVTIEPEDASRNRVKVYLRSSVTNNVTLTARAEADPTVLKRFVLKPLIRAQRLSIESTSVTITKSAATISSDPLNPTVINLNAVIVPATASRTNVTWSTDVSGIVTLDVSGADSRHVAVTGVGAGTVRIVAVSTDNQNARSNLSLTVQMVGTVSEIVRVDGLPLNTPVRQGAPVDIYVSRMPTNAAINTNPKTIWASSDAKSLTVATSRPDPANPHRFSARITAVAAPESNNATITFTGRNSALTDITRTASMRAFIPIATVTGVTPSISAPFINDTVQMSVGAYTPLNASDTTFRWYVLDAPNPKSSPRLPATSPVAQNASIDMTTGVLTCLRAGTVSIFAVANEITNIATLTARDSGKKFNKIDLTIQAPAPGLNIYTSDASGSSSTILRYNKAPLKMNYTLNGTIQQTYFARYTTGGKSIVVDSNGTNVTGVSQDPSGVVYICANPNQVGPDSVKMDLVDAAGKVISIRNTATGVSTILTKSIGLNVGTAMTAVSTDRTLYGIPNTRGPNCTSTTGPTFRLGATVRSGDISVALISDASNVSWPSPIPNNVNKGPAGASFQSVLWTQESGPIGIISFRSGSATSRLTRIRALTTSERAANPNGIPIVLKAKSFDGNFEATVTVSVL